MRRAGVSFVTLGVFSWSWLEPAKGEYEFGWLDDDHGPAGAERHRRRPGDGHRDARRRGSRPPSRRPSRSTATGIPSGPGSRQAWCPSNETYREHALALTTALATRYHEHPALAMWHVSNEYACHNLPCYCDTCAGAFRRWLRRRYPDLEDLNEAWGTAFWSQRYTEWDQILPPRRTTTFANPTQVLDYARFGSDTLLDFYRAEKEVINRLSPGVPVTTNFMTMSGFRLLDYHQWAPEQDVVSTDHYLVDTLPDQRAELAFADDLTRGLAGGRPWLLMEHSTSAVNWQPVNHAKWPGPDACATASPTWPAGPTPSASSSGGPSRSGSEKFHSGLVPARRGRQRPVPRGLRAGRGRDPARRGASAAPSTPTSRCCGTTRPPGPRAARRCRPPSSTTPTPPTPCTACCGERGVTCDVVHPVGRPVGLPRRRRPDPLPRHRRARRRRRPRRAGRRARCSSRSSPASPTRTTTSASAATPGRSATCWALRVEELFPLLPGEDGRPRGRGRGAACGRRTSTPARRRGARPVCRRPPRRPAGRHPPRRRLRARRGTSARCPTTPGSTALLGARAGGRAACVRRRPCRRGSTPSGAARRRGSWLFLVNDTTRRSSRSPADGHDLVADRPVVGSVRLPPRGVAVVRET